MPSIRRVLSVVTVGLLLFLALGAWALSSPVGSAPDDDFHLASIWCGSGPRDGLCEQTSKAQVWDVPDKIVRSTCYAFHADVNASCQGASFQDQGFELEGTRRVNAGSNQYPSGYYFWMSFLAGDNVVVSAIAMRLVNSALFSALTVSTWFLLPRRFRFTLVGAIAATAVPLAIFLVPANNPSSWSIMSLAVMFPALLGFFAAKGKRAVALGAVSVLTALMGFAARGDSAAYAIVAICAALVLSFRPDRRFLVRAALPLLVVILAVIAFLGAGQTGLAIGGMEGDAQTESRWMLIVNNLFAMPALWSGIFGLGWGLGWIDTSVHPVVWGATIFAVAGLLFASLKWQGWRKLLAVLGTGAAAVAVPLYILVSSGAFVGEEVQPRYILPLVTLFVATMLAPSEDPANRGIHGTGLSSLQLWTFAALLTSANAVALYNNLHRYTGPGVLSGDVAWWWPVGPSPLVTWMIGAVAFAGVMGVVAYTSSPVGRLNLLAAESSFRAHSVEKSAP